MTPVSVLPSDFMGVIEAAVKFTQRWGQRELKTIERELKTIEEAVEEFDVGTLIPSLQSKLTAAVLRSTVRALGEISVIVPMSVSLPIVRVLLDAAAGIATDRKFVHIPIRERHSDGWVRGEWDRWCPELNEKIIYYIHGSGYVVCSPATHRGLVSQLSRRTERAVFSLDYRMGPKYKFPSANEDALRGYRWLLDLGYSAENIVVAGDSAGGHLALALLGDLKAHGLPQPAGVVCFSPLVDASFGLASGRAKQVFDPWFHPNTARRGLGLYTTGADHLDPRFDVRGVAAADLPPVLIQAGAQEMMSADAEAFAAAVTAAGGTVELQIWPGQVHVFQAAYRVLPEARRALNEAARFIRVLDAKSIEIAG